MKALLYPKVAVYSHPQLKNCFTVINGLFTTILSIITFAEVAELVDALDSKSSSGNGVRVRFPPRVLKNHLTY